MGTLRVTVADGDKEAQADLQFRSQRGLAKGRADVMANAFTVDVDLGGMTLQESQVRWARGHLASQGRRLGGRRRPDGPVLGQYRPFDCP
jgi:hypothetical protein